MLQNSSATIVKDHHLRKVQPRNKNTYATSDVKSSSVQVGCIRNVGIIGTRTDPQTQPVASAPSLQAAKVQKVKDHNTSER